MPRTPDGVSVESQSIRQMPSGSSFNEALVMLSFRAKSVRRSNAAAGGSCLRLLAPAVLADCGLRLCHFATACHGVRSTKRPLVVDQARTCAVPLAKAGATKRRSIDR
jgi:hypothetical protein